VASRTSVGVTANIGIFVAWATVPHEAQIDP
jgi:hypothetical protein